MSWLNTRWRYSVAGVVQPANPTGFDQQQRFSVAGVPIAEEILGGIDGDLSATLGGLTVSFTGTFTPYVGLQLDYDEALSFVAIPEPSDLDVTKRYAIANVPTIGLADSIDRDGLLSATLGSVTVDFDGTVSTPAYDGAIDATLGGLTASFVGEFTFRHYFDVGFAIVPTWVVTEQPARFGDISVTLGGLTTSFTGFALPPDSTQGAMSAALSGLTIDFDGTYTAPPTFTGRTSLDLSGLTASLRGSFVPLGGTGGAMGLQLDGLSTAFQGTFEKWNTDGTANLALGPITVHIEGQFADSDATFGVLQATLESLVVNFIGDTELPDDIDTFQMQVESPGTLKMHYDQPDTLRMKT